jgi:hypothetical protein
LVAALIAISKEELLQQFGVDGSLE